MMMVLSFVLVLVLCTLHSVVFAANKNKPHGHQGTLVPYDGKLITVKVTAEQNKQLEKGSPVRRFCIAWHVVAAVLLLLTLYLLLLT
jgi:hypothetical protein